MLGGHVVTCSRNSLVQVRFTTYLSIEAIADMINCSHAGGRSCPMPTTSRLSQMDTWTGEHVKVDWPPTKCITGGARDGGRPDLSQSEGYHERAVVVAARSGHGDKR